MNSVASASHKMDEHFCDRRLALLISHMHNTSDYWQCCRVRDTAKQCRLRLFQFEDSVEIGGNFVPCRRSNLCSNQVDALDHWDSEIDICTHHHHPSARRDPIRRVHSVRGIPNPHEVGTFHVSEMWLASFRTQNCLTMILCCTFSRTSSN